MSVLVLWRGRRPGERSTWRRASRRWRTSSPRWRAASCPCRSARSFRPPTRPAGMGLMPAHRGGGEPVFSLKEIVVAPANAARGLDPHQGAVLLHDGETGVLVARPQRLRRSPRSGRRPSRRSRRSSSRGPTRGRWRSSARASRADRTRVAMRAVLPRRRAEGLEPHAGARRGARARGPRERVRDRRGGARRRRRRLHLHRVAASPSSRSRLAGAGRARQRRRLVRAVRPGARRRPRRVRVALRRPARVDRSTSPATTCARSRSGASGRTTSSPSSASSSSAPTRAVATTRR